MYGFLYQKNSSEFLRFYTFSNSQRSELKQKNMSERIEEQKEKQKD